MLNNMHDKVPFPAVCKVIFCNRVLILHAVRRPAEYHGKSWEVKLLMMAISEPPHFLEETYLANNK